MNVHSKHTGDIAVITILVFRTNIRFSKDIRALKEIFDNEPGILQWNIDRHDVDKVLRIKTSCLSPADVIRLVKKTGYLCEELPD